jgi:uncharacterized protein
MTVQTSYPGVYIQEIPSLVHTITPAPTSVAVFVGYTHPFLTKQPGTPVQLFSFADYQANFGGFFFSGPWQPDYVGHAVFQFFQNGGQTCFVVGLAAAHYYNAQGAPVGPVVAATLEVPSTSIVFTALQPVGLDPTASANGIPMTVTISNVQSSPSPASDDIADIVISYGSTVETYRKVAIGSLEATLANSNLATATPGTGTSYTPGQFSLGYGTPPVNAPDPTFTVINPTDFGPVFLAGNPLDKAPVFNLLVTPGITDSGVASEAVAYCEAKRAFYIADTPSSSAAGQDVNSLISGFNGGTAPALPPVSINAAVYYPWLMMNDPITGQAILSPPSGFVAGIYGQEDTARGVWKSPAGTETALLGTTGVDPNGIMTDLQQGVLNSNAVDCLRQFPGIGTVVFGARTTAGADANSAQQQWRYIAVRRTALFIEQSLYASLTWAVFEENAAPLWQALTQDVTAFMLSLFRQGAFAGTTPSEAFVVQCDATTTTPTDVANGVVNILVGFAPLSPAEFVVVQITQLTGQN